MSCLITEDVFTESTILCFSVSLTQLKVITMDGKTVKGSETTELGLNYSDNVLSIIFTDLLSMTNLRRCINQVPT